MLRNYLSTLGEVDKQDVVLERGGKGAWPSVSIAVWIGADVLGDPTISACWPISDIRRATMSSIFLGGTKHMCECMTRADVASGLYCALGYSTVRYKIAVKRLLMAS